MNNAIDNEQDNYIKDKINIKTILINSFKFLILKWKLFAIVLAFHILKSFIFGQYSYTNNFPTLTQQYFEFVLMQIPRMIIDLLFWVSIIPVIILAVKEYQTRQEKLIFWKKTIIRYFAQLFTYKFLFSVFGFVGVCFSAISMFKIASIPELYLGMIGGIIFIFEIILGFILFLAPVIIVLENKTFIDGAKNSIHIVRNKFFVCLIFILILNFLNPSNIFFMFLIINQYAPILGFDYIQLIQNPGFSSFQLILSSGWFIIYNAAIVGFYLRISKREDIQRQKNNWITKPN